MTVPRQRRRHTPLMPLPLPLSSSSKRSPTSNSASWTALIMCMSIVSITLAFLFLCAFMSTFHTTPLANDGNARGLQRRRAAQPIKHVSLTELQSSLSHPYDVIVVGCGPAGLTSALFASRMGMSVLVLGSPSSGALAGTAQIDNFPSFFGEFSGGGQALIDATIEQASFFGARFAPPALLATALVQKKTQHQANMLFEVQLGNNAPKKVVAGKTVIIASGSNPNKLNLPHETSLWGHSLHSCALCDGDLYARGDTKKSVAVIGGGDAAVEAIFLLHKLGVGTIHWIHRREEYKASSLEVKRVQSLPNVDVWTPFVVSEWMVKEEDDANAEDNPSALTLEGIRITGATPSGVADPKAMSSLTIPCDGAFLMIGSTPNSKWLKRSGVSVDEITRLVYTNPPMPDSGVDRKEPQYTTQTSIPGVFAAGEIADGLYRQALTASSEGAKAAIDAERYLRLNGVETSGSSHSAEVVEEKAKTTKPNQVGEGGVAGSEKCDLTKLDCIKSVVSTHPVVVFSKLYCPYCRRALEALRTFTEIEPLVLDLTEIKDGFRVQDALAKMTGRRTVPNVFVGGESIGGGDETTALYRSGKLEGLLRKAGAVQ